MSRIEEALRRAQQIETAAPAPVPVDTIEQVEQGFAPAASESEALAAPAAAPMLFAAPEPDDTFESDVVETIADAVYTDTDADIVETDAVETRAVEAAPPAADAERDAAQKHAPNEKLIISDWMPPMAVEQYRKLAATLHQVQVQRGTRVVMVASAMAGEGKTLTAGNLALTLSESFRRSVLLIDADLRRPTLHNLFGIPNGSGLNEGLLAEHDTKLTLCQISPRLTVLPAGRPNPDPMGILSSSRMRRIVEDTSSRYEWVVIDTPPVGLLPDANLLADMVDMVVLVIGAGRTPFHLAERAVKAIGQERIVGVVLNRADETLTNYSYYQHYSNYLSTVANG